MLEKQKKFCKKIADNKIAFTLAEVLITLSIIGVVAAMTIPNLITKYQKEQTATSLKKTYSTLSNALALANTEQPIESWNYCDKFVAQTPDCAIAANLVPKLDVVEKFLCFRSPYSGANSNECMYKKYPEYGYTNVSDFLHYTAGAYTVILKDGTIILFSGRDDAHGIFMSIGLDVNGLKGPNKVGRDIFGMKLMKDTNNFYKLKTQYNSTYCQTIETATDTWRRNTSQGCLFKIMEDGWQIKEDYPWEEFGRIK